MAEHIHKTYSCDRCKEALGSERPQRLRTIDVRAQLDWRDARGQHFEWKDVCDACYRDIMNFFEPGERH